MKINAKSKFDLYTLEMEIRMIPYDKRWMFVAGMNDFDIMRTRNILPRLLLWYAKWRGGKEGRSLAIAMFFGELSRNDPNAINAMFEQTIDHIRFGKDTEEIGAAGGLCQREINVVLTWLNTFNEMHSVKEPS